MFRRILSICFLLFTLIFPLSAFAASHEMLEEEPDTEDLSLHPRFLLKEVSVHPRLLRDRTDRTNKFIKFIFTFQYQGEDFSFENFSANILGSLFCDFGVTSSGSSVYRNEKQLLYEGVPPLTNNQEIRQAISLSLPTQHKRLLFRGLNHCQISPNNIIGGEDLTEAERDTLLNEIRAASVSFDYRLKMARGRLRLSPYSS